MPDVRFEWDKAKAASNRVKHDVAFDEAETVFQDELAWMAPDPTHSEAEERQLILGLSSKGRLLVVSFTERRGAIRLISARKATATERRRYEEEAT